MTPNNQQGDFESEATTIGSGQIPIEPDEAIYDVMPLEEPHPVAEDPVAQDSSETDDRPKFDQKVRQDFDGLMYLGYLTHTFDWLGHSFHIRTLDIDHILEVGLLHKRYADSLADIKAYQSLVVAGCVVKLDGKPLATPLSNDVADSTIINQWPVVRKWYSPTIDHIYQEYLLLEARVQEVIAAMGKVSG
jgi:hypothetical protein